MKYIQLMKNGKTILGSDGVMLIDGRLSIRSTYIKIHERNRSFSKNFPHKLADQFYFTDKRWNKISSIFNI